MSDREGLEKLARDWEAKSDYGSVVYKHAAEQLRALLAVCTEVSSPSEEATAMIAGTESYRSTKDRVMAVIAKWWVTSPSPEQEDLNRLGEMIASEIGYMLAYESVGTEGPGLPMANEAAKHDGWILDPGWLTDLKHTLSGWNTDVGSVSEEQIEEILLMACEALKTHPKEGAGEIPLCPTCGRRASERIGTYRRVHIHGYMEPDTYTTEATLPCRDLFHDRADRPVKREKK